VLIAGGGQVMRMALVVNEGITADAMTPELVAERLAEVMDVSAANAVKVETLMGEEAEAAKETAAAG
jgi:hypothetical protein